MKVKEQAASHAALQPQNRLSRAVPSAPLEGFKAWLGKDMSDLMMTVLLQTGGWTRNPPDIPSNRHFNEPIIIQNLLTFELITVEANAL